MANRDEQALADARPIAAAPELLEALMSILELTDAGMTLRDYFAARVMQVLLSKDPEYRPAMPVVHGVAEDSYVIADAMLAIRNTKTATATKQTEPENPHRALLLQIHTELSSTASADADPANWEGYTLHRIEKLLWPEENK